MACNCCGGEGCPCHVIHTSDPLNYPDGYQIGPAYNISSVYYWIHRPYPVPITSTTWNSKFGMRLGPNAVIDTNPPYSPECPGVTHAGDYDYYTRSGQGWIAQGGTFSIAHISGATNEYTYPQSYTDVQLKVEDNKEERVCKLYSRARVYSDLDQTVPDWPETWDLIDTTPFSKKGRLGNKVVALPYAFGGGVTGVDLIFRCSSSGVNSPCIATTAGNASYVNGPIMCGEPLCTNHGSYNGTFNLKYTNIQEGFEQVCYGIRAQNIQTFFTAGVRTGINFQQWYPARYIIPGADCSAWFYPIGDIDGLNPDLCFGKQYYIETAFDGTTSIGLGVNNQGGYSYFVNDPFVLNITNTNSITYTGIWVNAPLKTEFIYDCSKLGTCESVVKVDPGETYSIGTVTVSRL